MVRKAGVDYDPEPKRTGLSQTSWWLGKDRASFTAALPTEAERMRESPIGKVPGKPIRSMEKD